MDSVSRYLVSSIVDRGANNDKASGGLPHSEITGSKPIPGSPVLIAGYHVLHRLLLPRHPPNALLALDPIQRAQGRPFDAPAPMLAGHIAAPACSPIRSHTSLRPTPPPKEAREAAVSVLDLERSRPRGADPLGSHLLNAPHAGRPRQLRCSLFTMSGLPHRTGQRSHLRCPIG